MGEGRSQEKRAAVGLNLLKARGANVSHLFERVATGSNVSRDDFVGCVGMLGLLVTEGEVRSLAGSRKYASDSRGGRRDDVNFHRFIALGDKDPTTMWGSDSEDDGQDGLSPLTAW